MKTHKYLVPFCEGSSTKEMTIDILIKGVSKDQFETCKNNLGLIHHE